MSEYEFWDELGNIFNAIVAYQHKTIEFNNRFVNPWLRLGTVFDQNDHNSDTLLAARKAIEIDQENGSNWLSLGDVYFKMGSFDDAANAYSKAIDLNPKLGWAYANLALANATRQKYTEAVNLYVKSLELIEGDKDRSMIWNRLGNVYRKVNDYENAFIAFQMADECDGQNTGFNDQLDDVTPEQRVMPIIAEVYVNNQDRSVAVSQPANTEGPAQSEETVVAVVDEAADVSVEETSVVMEVESVPENQTAEATIVNDVTAVAEPDVIADQEPEVATPAVEEVQVTNEHETEFGKPEVSLDEVAGEQQVEEPAAAELAQVPEGDADSAEAVSVVEEGSAPSVGEETDIEEAHLETINEMSADETEVDEIQLDSEEETLSEEVVSDDIRPDVTVEVLVEEIAVEESQSEFDEETLTEELVSGNAQPEMAPETVVEEIVAEVSQSESYEVTLSDETIADEVQPEVVAEVPMMDNGPEELQSEDMKETQPETSVETPVEDPDTAEVKGFSEETPTSAFADLDLSTESIAAPVMSHSVETFANPSALNQPVVLVIEDLAELIKESVPAEDVAVANPADETETPLEVRVETENEAEVPSADADAQSESVAVNDDVVELVAEIVALANVENEEKATIEDARSETAAEDEAYIPVLEMEHIQPNADNESVPDIGVEPAYEEFLKHAVEPIVAEGGNSVTNDLKAEPDTKNAHIWNELGNVYFNTGAFEEAVTAYSKAIELDDWFAWPYSNLALVYVQKEKYAEAILLYQRSIELFSSDKDKAITWNRLGNVYRRLADYDNAIGCYQRADELDPNNATRSLRSRFSLLGSMNIEQSPSIAG